MRLYGRLVIGNPNSQFLSRIFIETSHGRVQIGSVVEQHSPHLWRGSTIDGTDIEPCSTKRAAAHAVRATYDNAHAWDGTAS